MRFPPCTGEYLNLAGAGICGAGGLAATGNHRVNPAGNRLTYGHHRLPGLDHRRPRRSK